MTVVSAAGPETVVVSGETTEVSSGEETTLVSPASSASTGHPHVVQNFAPGLSSLPQFVQNMGTSPSLCLGNMIRARPKLAVAQHTNKRPDHASRNRVKMCPKIYDTNGAPDVAPMGRAPYPYTQEQMSVMSPSKARSPLSHGATKCEPFLSSTPFTEPAPSMTLTHMKS